CREHRHLHRAQYRSGKYLVPRDPVLRQRRVGRGCGGSASTVDSLVPGGVAGNQNPLHCHWDSGRERRTEWGAEVNVLIPNLGSTSVKYQILEMPSEKVLAKGRIERVTDYREAIAQIRTEDAHVDAVVLKAAHAGPAYRGTFVVDEG